jgi:hypothetical protein
MSLKTENFGSRCTEPAIYMQQRCVLEAILLLAFAAAATLLPMLLRWPRQVASTASAPPSPLRREALVRVLSLRAVLQHAAPSCIASRRPGLQSPPPP